jgi:FtsP/CotA-like multicopper oxidase with cupredoxin domain
MAPHCPRDTAGPTPGPCRPVLSRAERAPRLGASIAIACLVLAGTASAQAPGPESVPFAEPSVLEGRQVEPGTVEFMLTAAPTTASILPGTETDVYAYNGQIPGPTIEAREGERLIVRFRNDLPEPTTIHWHGLHIPITSDGSPLQLVQPGETYEYVLTIDPGTAGTYWYHPHPDHRTGFQVAKGLFGALIVRADDDPLPSGISEKLIVLSDNRFSDDGSVHLPDHASLEGRIDFENGREGDVMFVNDQVLPAITIRSGEVQRWRIINASGSRVYRLALEGQGFLHVGDDGGLFERPREVEEILLANSERVELLVRGTGPPGSRTTLRSLPYDRYIRQTRPADWETPRDLVVLQVSDEPPAAPVAIPEVLRPIVPIDTADVSEIRIQVLTQGFINGQRMDMNRVDVSTRLGATEIWQIENLVGMDHPFHLHGFRFQVLSRNGVPVDYLSWKDTVNVPRHETVRFIVRYDDYPGKWMFHCHILDHEDAGMMGILDVK